MKVYETENFIVYVHHRPEIDRDDGGHLVIDPKEKVSDRTKLSPELAVETMRLSMMIGEALVAGMLERGVEIGRVNYQENGNWTPHLHWHIYGRAKNAKYQKYGDPITPGHRDNYKMLTEADVAAIQDEIAKLEQSDKYMMKNWRVK